MNVFDVGDLILGTYRIEQVFAGGGMGMVCRARHLIWDIDLVIKHPRPEFLRTTQQRADFERECSVWSSLGLHPFVTTCFYSRQIEALPCVFAEYVEGGSLRDWIGS